jgi:hypothetical protein
MLRFVVPNNFLCGFISTADPVIVIYNNNNGRWPTFGLLPTGLLPTGRLPTDLLLTDGLLPIHQL